MKAARIAQYGDAGVVAVEELPRPPLGAGMVLVEVHAASLEDIFVAYMQDGNGVSESQSQEIERIETS